MKGFVKRSAVIHSFLGCQTPFSVVELDATVARILITTQHRTLGQTVEGSNVENFAADFVARATKQNCEVDVAPGLVAIIPMNVARYLVLIVSQVSVVPN